MISAADIALIASMPVLAAASAICSASETVLFGLGHGERVRLRKLDPSAARRAAEVLGRPRRLLILILILNVSVNVLFFVVSSVLARGLESRAAGAALSVASILGLTLLGEVVPKSLGTVYRVPLARLIVPIVHAADRALGPLAGALEAGIVRPLAMMLRPPGAGEARQVSPDELAALLEAAGTSGAFDPGEERLLTDVVELGTLRVKDIMTPRVKIAFLDERASRDDLVALVRSTGHTKFPVCRGGLDGTVVGVVNGRDYLAAVAAGRLPKSTHVVSQASKTPFIPDRARLDQVLDALRRSGAHVAMCVDEFGTLTGLIEVEDVVRQIVRSSEPAAPGTVGVERLGPGRWSVPGSLRARDWADFFHADDRTPLTRADREASTVAGLVLCRLGRVPQVGDVARIGNVILRVTSMSGRVIERVGVEVGAEDNAAAGAGGGRA